MLREQIVRRSPPVSCVVQDCKICDTSLPRWPADWGDDREAACGRCDCAGGPRLHICGQPAGVPRSQHRRGRHLRSSLPRRLAFSYNFDVLRCDGSRSTGIGCACRCVPRQILAHPVAVCAPGPLACCNMSLAMPGVRHKGERLRSGLREAFSGNPHVKEVRGQGLICGIQLDTVSPAAHAPAELCVSCLACRALCCWRQLDAGQGMCSNAQLL